MATRRELLRQTLTLAVLVAGTAGFAALARAQSTGTARLLSPAELSELLSREDPFLIDVHVPAEGYLPGTDARIPYSDVAARRGELPADPEAAIVVTCMSGRMSAVAAAALVELGYRRVYDLDGGMLAWRAAGYAVVSE